MTKTETINGTTTAWSYGYDTAGRLTDTLLNGAVYAHYDYDANGNRLDKTNGAGTVLAAGTYDAQDRMLSYGNNTYSYTANGELTAKTNSATGETTTYQYDVLGNLKHVNLPDGTAIDYVVDGRNRRIGKKVNGALTEAYLYDGQLRPIAQLDASGNVVSRFVYATHINVPDYIIKGTTTYKIITDHLGSPRFVIDPSTGTIAQRMDYDDFGNVLLDTDPGFTPFGFAGGIYDSQTKLVRFGARDYDAETGRWTSKDPIGFAGRSSNLFGYVLGDPVNGADVTGRFLIPVGVAAGVLIGALAVYAIVEFIKNVQGTDQPQYALKPGCGGAGCHFKPKKGQICPVGPVHYHWHHSGQPPYDSEPYIMVPRAGANEGPEPSMEHEHTEATEPPAAP